MPLSKITWFSVLNFFRFWWFFMIMWFVYSKFTVNLFLTHKLATFLTSHLLHQHHHRRRRRRHHHHQIIIDLKWVELLCCYLLVTVLIAFMSWTVKRSKLIYISSLRKIWWLMVSKALLEPRRKMQSTELPLSIADKTISASETMASLLLCFFLNPYWRSVLILNLVHIWGLLRLRNPYMIDLSIGMNENLKFSFEKRIFIWQCFP